MAEIKQYINLEPDSNDATLGRIKKVKVKLQNQENALIYLFLSPDSGNKDSAKLLSANRAGIDSAGIGKTMTTSGVDGTIEFGLVLSNYGGDKFKVKAAMDALGKKDMKEISDTYIVWKKIFYQLSYMKDSLKFPFDITKDEYKKHFIELEETSSLPVPYKENLETKELNTYRKHFKKKKSPFEVHIVLIDRQCDSGERSFSHKMVSSKNILPYSERVWTFSDWLVEAKVSVSGGAYSAKNIIVTQVDKGIGVDVTGLGVDPAKVDVNVKITIKILIGAYGGDASFPPHVFIAVGSGKSDARLNMALVHELGHGVGMVPSRGHALHYENRNGGMGNHCHDGATPDVKSAAQGGTFAGTYANGTCAMFHSATENTAFCITCKEFVRDAMLYESNVKSRGWGN